MKLENKQHIADSVRSFRLPRYNEIPNVGLYLEQTTKYVAEYLAPLQENAITSSMVSNYVKKGLVPSPVKKLYTRDQICYLMFIALAKSVVSLDDLKRFIRLQERTYTMERAYSYFCLEFENLLQYVFGIKESVDTVGQETTDEKFMFRATIIAIAHKIYLDKCFETLALEEE